MEIPSEMQKLRQMLTEMGIKWQDNSAIYPENMIRVVMGMYNVSRESIDVSIYRTQFNVIGCHYSVVCGNGTYGGEEGLLEMMGDGEDPTGWLTAEDIIGQIQKKIKKVEED